MLSSGDRTSERESGGNARSSCWATLDLPDAPLATALAGTRSSGRPRCCFTRANSACKPRSAAAKAPGSSAELKSTCLRRRIGRANAPAAQTGKCHDSRSNSVPAVHRPHLKTSLVARGCVRTRPRNHDILSRRSWSARSASGSYAVRRRWKATEHCLGLSQLPPLEEQADRRTQRLTSAPQ